jgi:hypothetical protein
MTPWNQRPSQVAACFSRPSSDSELAVVVRRVVESFDLPHQPLALGVQVQLERLPLRAEGEQLSGVDRHPAMPTTPSTSSAAGDGDGFDLDELVVVAQDAHAEQGAGGVEVTERGPDDGPGRDEVRLPGRGDEDGWSRVPRAQRHERSEVAPESFDETVGVGGRQHEGLDVGGTSYRLLSSVAHATAYGLVSLVDASGPSDEQGVSNGRIRQSSATTAAHLLMVPLAYVQAAERVIRDYGWDATGWREPVLEALRVWREHSQQAGATKA